MPQRADRIKSLPSCLGGANQSHGTFCIAGEVKSGQQRMWNVEHRIEM